MARLLVLFAASALLLAAYAEKENSTSSEEVVGGLKQDAAEGRRHRHRDDYYDEGYGYGGYGHNLPQYSSPIHDKNVCDLDASVLLVTDHSRRGHNKAHRVRCADVAAHDEDSCNICCQNAARRDRSVKNEDIYGMLVVVDGFDREDRHKIHKRGAGHKEESHSEDALSKRPRWKGEDNIDFFRNVKCMCCAPRRNYVAPPVPVPVPVAVPQPVPVYAAPQYPSYPSYAAPQQNYQQAQPSYQQAQPTYQQAQPTYQQAQAQPTYQQAQPSFSAPVQSYQAQQQQSFSAPQPQASSNQGSTGSFQAQMPATAPAQSQPKPY